MEENAITLEQAELLRPLKDELTRCKEKIEECKKENKHLLEDFGLLSAALNPDIINDDIAKLEAASHNKLAVYNERMEVYKKLLAVNKKVHKLQNERIRIMGKLAEGYEIITKHNVDVSMAKESNDPSIPMITEDDLKKSYKQTF